MATTTVAAAPVAAAAASFKKVPKQLPAPNTDFYDLYETLNAEELAVVKRVGGCRSASPEKYVSSRPVRRRLKPFARLRTS